MHDADFLSILICAVRYCLGRRTYMPEIVTRWIMKNCKLDKKTAEIMLDDIERQRDPGFGDSCDYDTWNRFETWLLEGAGIDDTYD